MAPEDFMLVHIYYSNAWELYRVDKAEIFQRLQGITAAFFKTNPEEGGSTNSCSKSNNLFFIKLFFYCDKIFLPEVYFIQTTE
jgi:hypothetical protein